MSTLRCPVVRLGAVEVHDNADALEVVNVLGYQAVVQKGLHQAGDLVIYVPEGAVLPDSLLEEFGFKDKLAGKDKNRVKAVRLRGKLSQGLVLPASKIADYLIIYGGVDLAPLDQVRTGGPDQETLLTWQEGGDCAAALGITKWEPPIPVHMQGEVEAAPEWFRVHYDIENIKTWPDILQPNEPVAVTEKIHGTNMRAGWHRTEGFFVTSRQRDLTLKHAAHNLYWRAAEQEALAGRLEYLANANGWEWVIVFGEVFGAGVQDLHYGHKPGEISFRAFDVLHDGVWLDYEPLIRALDEVGIPRVTTVMAGAFSMVAVQEAAAGNSVHAEHVREGVVVRPWVNRRHDDIGRVVLKAINPDYLTRKGGTEFH